MSKEKSTSTGIGTAGLLGVAFVVLKLTGYINWNWWWVLLPFWFWIPIVIILLLLYGVFTYIENRN